MRAHRWYMTFDGAASDTIAAAQRAADRTGRSQEVHYHKQNEECAGREHLTVNPRADVPASVEPHRYEHRS